MSAAGWPSDLLPWDAEDQGLLDSASDAGLRPAFEKVTRERAGGRDRAAEGAARPGLHPALGYDAAGARCGLVARG